MSYPYVPPQMPNMSPNTTNTISQVANMIQNGIDPIEEIKKLRDTVADLKSQLVKKQSDSMTDIDEKLLLTEEGKSLYQEKQKKLLDLFVEFALSNPVIGTKVKCMMDDYENKAKKLIRSE